MASDFDPRFDPAFQRGYSGAPPADPPSPVAPEPAHPAARAKRNPWLATLWALAGLLVVVGGVGYWWAASQTNPDFEVTGVVFPAVIGSLSPWVGVVGLLGVVLAVYVQAAQWRRP